MLWDFGYVEYLRVFKLACEAWKLEGVVPYQMRHSGPSIDRAQNLRSLVDCQKRGRWASWKSVTRYEKSARLSASWGSIGRREQEAMLVCERHLEALVLGHPGAPEHVVPA